MKEPKKIIKLALTIMSTNKINQMNRISFKIKILNKIIFSMVTLFFYYSAFNLRKIESNLLRYDFLFN